MSRTGLRAAGDDSHRNDRIHPGARMIQLRNFTTVVSAGLLAVLINFAAARKVDAQSLPAPRILRTVTVPEIPSFGEPFRMEVTLRVAAGTSIEIPDTLLAVENAEGVGRGERLSAGMIGDSLDVTYAYPVIAYLAGPVLLPRLEVKIRGVTGPAVVVDPTDRAEVAPVAQALVLLPGAVVVAPFPPMENSDSGAVFLPRPLADVLGADWSTGFLLALALATLVTGGVLVAAIRRLGVWQATTSAARRRERNARELALRELEQIRAAGWADRRMDAFYDETTTVLRTFASRVEPGWVPALTSGELILRIEARWGTRAAPLRPVIERSEGVKFGRLHPTTDEAEAHWRVVHSWIRDLPGA